MKYILLGYLICNSYRITVILCWLYIKNGTISYAGGYQVHLDLILNTVIPRTECFLPCLFVCFDLGFHTRIPVIKYRPDASCMSYMEACAEMPGENNFHSPG